MSRRVSLFIAMSLDGYIAAEGESLDWLEEVEGEGDNGFSEFYGTVDTIVMGRRTYNWVMRQDLEEWPYPGKQTYVITNGDYENTPHVTFARPEVLRDLKQQSGNTIWIVGGGDLLRTYLNRGDITDIIVTVAPILLGGGIPLFDEVPQTKLVKRRVREFGQFTEMQFEVKG
ncbi:dihydrofolate reductase family protein [Salimicrobium halophilum]|uniref:Dihydrofolate reductase n=1 Tax=Salimicrobium halophilum TaxID=86666 RepID=A0A1G8T1S8_9BACI|nr:dihydrofolate reductase family protein [Salimicrobium halophilum]SDJ35529.1 Dihydrofolate reductase [Salimicrobium halophilum]